jgi:hypothetical protein
MAYQGESRYIRSANSNVKSNDVLTAITQDEHTPGLVLVPLDCLVNDMNMYACLREAVCAHKTRWTCKSAYMGLNSSIV